MKITVGRKIGAPLCFDSDNNEKVLHAALRSRLTAPYECATGTCGSCRAKLVSGELSDAWPDAPGKKALKIQRGEFLMCQCIALSDCTIRIPTAVATSELDVPAPDHLSGTLFGYKKLTSDVLSFSVTLDQQTSFQAGQFMLLQLPGIEGARAYSMVNYASQTHQLDFVIKHFEGGECSKRLFDLPQQNGNVKLFGPVGHAVFEPQLKHDLLLLAGGSGIAGMMAILGQADHTNYLQSRKIDLIFGVRSEQDIFYLSDLRKFASEHPKALRITIALSDVQRANVVGDTFNNLPPNLRITNGFVHELIDESRSESNTMAFIAGPPPMVDASIRELVAGQGFSVDRIRYDKFA